MDEMTIENAKITYVSLTMKDHGVLTFWVGLEGNGWGCSRGGFVIGHGYLGAKEFKAERGDGLEAMMKIMDTVGVESWEDLQGKYVRVELGKFSDGVHAIGNLIKDKWFDVKSFFAIRSGKQ